LILSSAERSPQTHKRSPNASVVSSSESSMLLKRLEALSQLQPALFQLGKLRFLGFVGSGARPFAAFAGAFSRCRNVLS
jgi:hypothetical protein